MIVKCWHCKQDYEQPADRRGQCSAFFAHCDAACVPSLTDFYSHKFYTNVAQVRCCSCGERFSFGGKGPETPYHCCKCRLEGRHVDCGCSG